MSSQRSVAAVGGAGARRSCPRSGARRPLPARPPGARLRAAGAPPSATVNSGGPGAEWELIETITTGNPHTDLDFFTQGGETYASVGTLGIGPNGGGQTIVQLTEGGDGRPELRLRAPVGELHQQPGRGDRAPARRRGDAEGRRDPQRAQPVRGPHRHPAPDRRHRRRRAAATTRACSGSTNAPQGGLEIVDVTDVAEPGRDRADQPHRRVAHGQRRPEASAHRLLGRPPTRSRVDDRRRRAQNEDPGELRRASTSTASRSSTSPPA